MKKWLKRPGGEVRPAWWSVSTAVIFVVLSMYGSVWAMDAPHNTASEVSCPACHGASRLSSPFWGGSLTDEDFDNFCLLNCHDETSGGPYTPVDAPWVQTHSSANTSDTYGTWHKRCLDCHHQHSNQQNSRDNRGLFGDDVYLATADVDSWSYDSGADESTVDYSGLSLKGSWTVADLLAKTSEYRRAILLPSQRDPRNNFQVTGMTESGGAGSITVKGNIGSVRGLGRYPLGFTYNQFIREEIDTDGDGDGDTVVRFIDRTGTASFVDGDASYNGICQACHTQTGHFRRLGVGGAPDQNHDNVGDGRGTNCISCHPHDTGFAHGGGVGVGCVECHGHDAGTAYDPDMTAPYTAGGIASQGAGTYESHSTHTETDGDDIMGPGIYCSTCHDITKFPYFNSGTDSNLDGNIDLSETDVCDTCHSPGGTYDGIDDATVGAKANWGAGVYDGFALKAGREKWCATCHDEEPSVIQGVSAPDIVGDEDGFTAYGTGWGYYKTGHGLADDFYPASGAPGADQTCSGCHDFSVDHIDGTHRTYLAASDNYQAGYRLNTGMDIPRTDQGEPVSDFALCFTCHDSGPYLTEADYTTNFRNNETVNAHYLHLQSPSTGPWAGGGWWDSDWDGATGDSKLSCTACHNVHGSPSPRMFRHGELISTPGTTDKVPSLDFSYLPDPDTTLPESTGGRTSPDNSGGGSIANSGICGMCHSNTLSYSRAANDLYPPAIIGVYGSTGSDTLIVTFSKGVYTGTGATGALIAADFVIVDADNGRTITGVSHTPGNDVAYLTLSAALDDTADIDVDTLAASSDSAIYDESDNPMGTDAVAVSSDTDKPSIADRSPADSAVEINVYGDVSFSLSDSDSGVDWTTFSIQLSGDRGYSQTYTDTDTSVVSKTGSAASYVVTVDPDTYFSHDEVITATVNVDDRAGNSLTPAVWSFTTLTGGGPFTRTLHPSGLASNPGTFTATPDNWPDILDSNDGDLSYAYRCCGPGGEIFYMDMDDPIGLDNASIQGITFHTYARWTTGGGENAPVASDVDVGYKTGTATVWRGVYTTDDTGEYNLVSSTAYTTDSDGGTLDLTDINNLQIAVNRYNPYGVNGRQMRATEVYAEIAYGVPEGDATSPTVSGLSPADGASEVAVDSNLTFTLADTGGGVDWETFEIVLNGDLGYSQTYTDLDTSIVSKTGSMAEYEVTVNPDTDFSTGEVITVAVNVDDRSANSLAPPSWSFTTESVSTQTLHPSGLGELIDDSVSDVQAIGGAWADILDTNDGDTSHAYLDARHNGGGPQAGYHPAGFKVEMDDVTGMTTFSEVRAYFVFTYDCYGGGSYGAHDKIFVTLDTGSGTTETSQEYQYAPGPNNDPSEAACEVPAYTTISVTSTTDPDGGPWDLTDIQALRAGFKIQPRNVGWQTVYGRVTEVYVEVDP